LCLEKSGNPDWHHAYVHRVSIIRFNAGKDLLSDFESTGKAAYLKLSKLVSFAAFSSVTCDRCYDFLNIFGEKFSEKFGVFDSKQS
jgi:hypothetical protein